MSASFEQQHVHSVYNAMSVVLLCLSIHPDLSSLGNKASQNSATHFSSTRYKTWPLIAEYLDALPVGSLVLDAGCGNGKYLSCSSALSSGSERRKTAYVGLDRSEGLLDIAAKRGHEVLRADVLDLSCFRPQAFTNAISIATLHHLSTPSRRLEATKQLLLALRPSPTSSALIFVWAREMDPQLEGRGSARKLKGKTREVPPGAKAFEEPQEEDEEGQDVFVPWTLAPGAAPPKADQEEEPKQQEHFERYYHLFSSGELGALVKEAARQIADEQETREGERIAVELVREGWERENWFVEVRVTPRITTTTTGGE